MRARGRPGCTCSAAGAAATSVTAAPAVLLAAVSARAATAADPVNACPAALPHPPCGRAGPCSRLRTVTLQGMAPYPGQAAAWPVVSGPEWPRRLAVKGRPVCGRSRVAGCVAPLTVRGATAQSRGHPRTLRRAFRVFAGAGGYRVAQQRGRFQVEARRGSYLAAEAVRADRLNPARRRLPELKTATFVIQFPGVAHAVGVPGAAPLASELTLDSRTPPCIPWHGVGGGWPNEVDVRCLP
jgi:hypothetical protein